MWKLFDDKKKEETVNANATGQSKHEDNNTPTCQDQNGEPTPCEMSPYEAMTDRELMLSMAHEIGELRKELFVNRVVFAVCSLVGILYAAAKFSDLKEILSALIMVFME